MQLNNFISLEQAVDREPLIVDPKMPVEEVIELMSQNWQHSCLLEDTDDDLANSFNTPVHISCVLAIADSQLQGIFTERDLVRLIAVSRTLKGLTLADVMSRDVITLTATESQDIFAAINLLRQHQICHLPIIDQENHILGLVTQASLRQALQYSDLLKFRQVKDVMSRTIEAHSTTPVQEIAQLMNTYQVSCIPIVEIITSSPADVIRPLGIITERDIVQFLLLELNLERLQAQQVMSTPLFLAKPEDSLWVVHQQMQQNRVRRLVVTGKKGELLGVVNQSSLLQTIDSTALQGSLEILQRRVRQLEQARVKSLQQRNLELENQMQLHEAELRRRTQQEQAVAAIALRIRQSLNLESVLHCTVTEVQQLMQANRVLIYRFEPDWSGIVTTEAVSQPQWSVIDRVIKDDCFAEAWLNPYRHGHLFSVSDIHQSRLSQCHIEFLEQFQVKANIAVPILLTNEEQSDRLWGLLIVHQCSAPRNWQESELELLKLLSTQIAIAIQQAELYEQAQTEIARRRQAETALRESESRFRIMANNAPVMIWMSDTNKLHTFFNQPWLDFTGRTLEQEQGEGWRDRVHPDDLQGCLDIYTSAFDARQEFTREYRLRRADGEYKWLLDMGVPRFDHDDNFAGYIGSAIDISDRKQIEAQYLRNQRLESLGSLASGVAHDLNNILTPIMMSVQLLPRTLKQIDSRSLELIQMLESNVKRGSALVKQVLSFARGIESHRGIVQVKHLIEDIKQIAEETFPKSIQIQTYISPRLWTIQGNATQIHQIILNLVVNARDAMPNGGILSITAENIAIDHDNIQIHSEAKIGSYVVISVADTGIGIPSDIKDQIFEPFFTTKEASTGTGLGLATVMGIVKSHGGFIDVSSEIGQGTQFKIFLTAITETETEPQTTLDIPQGTGELVLVVDDEATIREITKASLEANNYQVLTAADGIEAIALYVQNQAEIAVVLMNMMMPSMDGTTAIRTLQTINSDVKVVAVSGRNFTDQSFSDRQINIQAFLAKPYNTETLLEVIGEVVNS